MKVHLELRRQLPDPGIPPDALRQRYGCGAERLRPFPVCISTGRVTAAQRALRASRIHARSRDHAIIPKPNVLNFHSQNDCN